MSIELRPPHIAILEALATYRLLTPEQLYALGVTKHMRHVHHLLSELHPHKSCSNEEDEASPPKPRGLLIECLKHGTQGPGSRPRVWYLTRAGAQKLSDINGELEPIQVPAKVEPYGSEYEHRTDTIDVHIALRRFAESSGFQVDFVHTYFGRGEDRYRTRVRYTLEKRPASIVPDMIFSLISPRGIRRLYAFEMYEGVRTKRAFDRLTAYGQVIAQEAIEKAFGYAEGSVQVLAVFHPPSAERLERERLAGYQAFASSAFAPLFFFKSLDEVKADFRHGWRHVGKSSNVSLF
jgi:hypothetical protein